ncbi:hypothetical protein GDO78_007921 [Eleutherodactylus coqui]|uniref:Uncharacterized protein n=1 Tax=Eleutherodactylus coqui TaxID=57060 RepID=A0A8J6FK22_ELECQ|nr:hypothetical protein GDO78_007921 [Eleutherodactylus coqui]
MVVCMSDHCSMQFYCMKIAKRINLQLTHGGVSVYTTLLHLHTAFGVSRSWDYCASGNRVSNDQPGQWMGINVYKKDLKGFSHCNPLNLFSGRFR